MFTLPWINATTASLQQNTIFAEYARWLQHNYNIPILANKCSIQNKHTLLNQSNLPLRQCSVFLQGQYPTKYEEFLEKLHHALWNSAVCISRCLTLLSKEQYPLLEKSIFLHNICGIIDIEHPFQKCNIFEAMGIIKECFFASYHRTAQYCPVWKKIFLWRSSILGKLDYFCLTCVLFPLVRSAQPSFWQLSL